MKNKDRMQFNLKNWRKLNWSLWNKEDENKASFEKILNKDKYKKKQEYIEENHKLKKCDFQKIDFKNRTITVEYLVFLKYNI